MDFRTIPAMVGVLSFLVFFHELGHFVVAKYFGVRVDIFSIGFGTRLWGFKRGDTDYRISLLPLGGYVKMAGEYSPDDAVGNPDELMSKPRWQRFFIALAGPAMNVALALILITVVYVLGVPRPAFYDTPARIGWVAEGGLAEKAGIQRGDLIVKIDEVENPLWVQTLAALDEDLTPYERTLPRVTANSTKDLSVTVLRGTQKLTFALPAIARERAGWSPDQPPVISELEPGLPGDKAGLHEGDYILTMDGTPFYSVEQLIEHLQHTQGAPLNLTVRRGVETIAVTVHPQNLLASPTTRLYRMGAALGPTTTWKLPVAEAAAKSLQWNLDTSGLLFRMLGQVFKGNVKVKELDGPIGIMYQTGQAAKRGPVKLLLIAAGISLNLGLFNLLPFPILDGGMILFLLIEGLLRRDISLRIKERIYQVAVVFLIAFAVVVMYSDVMKRLS